MQALIDDEAIDHADLSRTLRYCDARLSAACTDLGMPAASLAVRRWKPPVGVRISRVESTVKAGLPPVAHCLRLGPPIECLSFIPTTQRGSHGSARVYQIFEESPGACDRRHARCERDAGLRRRQGGQGRRAALAVRDDGDQRDRAEGCRLDDLR